MSRSVDIFVVYNDDAEVWHRYVIEHLGKAQYDLRLQAVTDMQLLGWINHVASADLSPSSGPESGNAAHTLMEASLSKAFIVIASPGHIRVLYENPVFNYARLIKNPERAQILMWGVEHSDLFHPPSMLSTRFPQLDQWTKVSPVRPDYLLTNAVIMIESFGTPNTGTHQQPQPNNTVTSSAYDVPSRTPRPRTLPFPAKNKLHLQSAVTFDGGSLKRHNNLVFDDDIPHSPAPPLPSTGLKLNFDNGSHYDSGNHRETATPPRNARWKRQDFRIQPVSARCEEPTTMFVFFDDPIADMSGDVRLEVLVGDSGDKLSAEWVNPYTFSFIIPIHTEGLVRIKFILDGHDIGSRPLVFYSLTANIITGISQIYIEQIRSLLGALIRSHPANPERHGTQSLKRNETIATVGRASEVNATWSAPEIDQLMTKLFTGDSMEQIPVQAFEQIFGVYNHVDPATATQYECPTLVHLAAHYDLRELAARLVDLPDARLACAVQNSRGQRSDEVAKQQGHYQLAKFLENFRLVDDNFHVTREHIFSTNFTDETDGQCAPRARFSSLTDKSADAAENTYMDMSVYVANSSTRTKVKVKPVPPLPPSSTPAPAAAATEECIDDVDDEDTSDYEKMDLRGLPVVRTTSANISSPNQLEPMSREKLTTRRRLPPDPPPKLIRSDSIHEEEDDDYVERTEYDAALIKQREIDTQRSISGTPASIGTSTYDTPRQLTTGSSCSAINEHENDARLTAMDPQEIGATNELMPAILFPNMEDSMCGQQHQQQQVPLDDANPDLPQTFFTNSSASEFPSVSVACECDGHPQSLLNQEEDAADSNNNPSSCDEKRFPLHIELVGGALASPAEEVMSHSQLELVDIMRRVKENELTMDSAVQLFTGWKERNKRGLTRSFKEKKAQLEKIRHEIELSATSVTAEKSCGTKIKPKRSFSKILSFSKKSTHPTANEMTSPPSAHILCVPLSQSKIKKVQSLRCSKPMLNSSIPEDSQLVNVATPCGLDLSGREGVHVQVASVQRISSSSSSSAHSRDSFRSETSITSGIADLDVNTDDDEVQVRQTKKLLQPSSGLTSLVLHRRSKNLEMLVKDLSESSQPPPPPIPPRIVPRPVPEAMALTAATSTLSPCAHQPLTWSENSNTPSRDVHLAATDHVTAADHTSHTTTTTEHRSDIGSRTGDALGIEARLDRPQLPPRNLSTTNMATLEKSVSCESSFGQLTIQIPTYRKGSLPGDVCIDRSSPQPLSVFDVPAGHVSRQLTTSPDDANTRGRLQRSMSPCPSRPLPPVPTRPN